MNETRTRNNLVWGGILVAVGLLLLAGQVMNWMNWGNAWPLIIIGVGAAFFIGMILGGKSVGGLAIPGSIIATIGLILLVQNILGWWETWSYAWALIVASVGVGIAIQGIWCGQPEQRRRGLNLAGTGIVLFVIFGAIFELIFSATGTTTRGGKVFWSLLVLIIGAVQLAYRMYRLLRAEETQKQPDLFGPMLLIGVGIVALLASLGALPGELQLLSLLNLWPLLLIAAGLHLIIGRRSPWTGAAIGVLLVAALVIGTLFGQQLGLSKVPSWISSAEWEGLSWGNQTPVNGSGEVKEEERPVGDFDRVSFAAPGELKIVQGKATALTITAEENLLEYLITEVQGDKLVIKVKPGYNLRPKKTIIYNLALVDLREIEVSGISEASIGPLKTDDLKAQVSGAAKLELEDLQANRLQIDVSGASSANVAGEIEKMQIEVSGAGSASAAGETEELKVSISGAGKLDAGDLKCQQADADISGSGNVTAWVVKELSVQASGAGSFSYYGNPDVEKHTSGAGSVHRLGDK